MKQSGIISLLLINCPIVYFTGLVLTAPYWLNVARVQEVGEFGFRQFNIQSTTIVCYCVSIVERCEADWPMSKEFISLYIVN